MSRLREGLFFQPQTQVIPHRLNNLVARIITAVIQVARSGAQLTFVIFGARRRIEFIALTTQMKYGGFGWLTNFRPDESVGPSSSAAWFD